MCQVSQGNKGGMCHLWRGEAKDGLKKGRKLIDIIQKKVRRRMEEKDGCTPYYVRFCEFFFGIVQGVNDITVEVDLPLVDLPPLGQIYLSR